MKAVARIGLVILACLLVWLVIGVSRGVTASREEVLEVLQELLGDLSKGKVISVRGGDYVFYSEEEIKRAVEAVNFMVNSVRIFAGSGGVDCDDYAEFKMSYLRRVLPNVAIMQVYDYERGHAYQLIIDSNRRVWKWDSTTNSLVKLEKPFYHCILFVLLY